jgi:hypothetical protein
MKKTILAFALMTAFSAFAQTAVTAPAAPTVPTMVTVSPNAAAALAASSTNRVFIDQSGDNPDVNVTQDGNGNRQGSAIRPIYLRGIDQIIVTRQIGANNEIDLEVVNPSTADLTAGVITGAKVTVQQIGDGNTVDAACGYGTLSNGTTSIAGGNGCKGLDANWKFTGDNNDFQFRGKGVDINSAIDVSGDSNIFRIDVLGDKHTQTIKVVGDTNTFNINQASTGSSGSSIWVDLAGNNNTMTISQSGNIDNVLNIKSIANSGTFNIIQKN